MRIRHNLEAMSSYRQYADPKQAQNLQAPANQPARPKTIQEKDLEALAKYVRNITTDFS